MTMTENGPTTREQIEAKKAEIDAVQAQLDALGDRASADDHAKALGVADELADLLNQFKTETKVRGVAGEAHELLAELSGTAPTARVDPNDARAAATGINNPKGMTFGQYFVESDMYKEFQSRNIVSGEVKGIGGNTPSVAFGIGMPDVHALSTAGSDTSGGAFIEPHHMPGHVDNAEFREFTLWDLCFKMEIDTDTFDYVEVDSKTNNAAPVAEATSAAEIGDGTGGTVLPAAGGQKPESNLSTVKRVVTLEMIPHIHYVTRKAAAHAPQLMAIIDQFMRDGVEEETEDQLILGDGTSPNLRGLLNATNPYALNTFDMSDNGETQRIRAIAKAAGVVRTTSRRRPTAMLVHPNDWFSDSFLLEQDGNGNYKVGDPRATIEQLNSLWGLRVVVSEAVPEGTQVVGDFRQMVIGHTGQIMMYMSDSNRDLFERNILTLLAEREAGVGVLKPKAFCTVVA